MSTQVQAPPETTDSGAARRGSTGSGRFVREGEHALHEQRGDGWRAVWQEGSDSLVLEREPEGSAPAQRSA